MNHVNELLNNLQRNHILEALKRLDQGFFSSFSASIKYDLLFNGKKYAPKEVAGLALECMTGIVFNPRSFKGGESTSCFNALRRCGFTLIPKSIAVAKQSLKDAVDEVLKLQAYYSSDNTQHMIRRGELIRSDIPAHLWANIEKLEPIFSNAGYECAIEGSDGVGRKNVSPWVRVFDNQMSPSATEGWYIVLHFSKTGENFYLTLGCGATFFRGGSIVAIPEAELQTKVAWARQAAESAGVNVADYSDIVNLKGNNLSRQFERATAFAKSYGIGQLDENVFWSDLQALSNLLVLVYEKERLGKTPLAESLATLVQSDIEVNIKPSKVVTGQGRGLTYPERLAVELRAMEVVRSALIANGYTNVKDVSGKESFDFLAEKEGIDWIVEVKGTTSISADCFYLTAKELQLHNSKQGLTILALVSNINLDNINGILSASGGDLELISPWDVAEWSFTPISYRALRSKNN